VLVNWLPKFQKIIWAAFLVSLPVTSFPYFPGGLGGRTEVRPLALYPLVLLLVIVVLPRLFTKPIPRVAIPLAAFALVAVFSTLLALGRGIDPDINITVSARSIRMLVTLALGGAFFLTVAIMPHSSDDLQFSLRWLFIGLGIALLWGSLQVIYIIKYDPQYFAWMSKAQQLISFRRLFDRRVSGMTYEPSWFAEQITFLYMPWLFAAIMSNSSVFRYRKGWLTIELMLLVWSAFVLIYTFSRSGLVFMVVQLVLAIFFRERLKRQAGINWILVLKRIAQGTLGFIAVGLIIFTAASQNRNFSRLWNYWTDEDSTGSYFQYIAFSQRFAYWETAYHIYEGAPLLGVGLGNYTFYFEDKLTDRPIYPTPELFDALVPKEGRHQLVVPKNLFARILAETGLMGMATFFAFLIAIIGSTAYLLMGYTVEQRYWGRAGLLGMIVFIGVAFSVDSFAIPNMWINFGFITASVRIFSRVV